MLTIEDAEMENILTLAAVVLLASCAQNPKYANIQPHEWTELTCSGFLTWNDCRQEARALCPQGFTSLTRMKISEFNVAK